jgi:maltose O-acetyltransferase
MKARCVDPIRETDDAAAIKHRIESTKTHGFSEVKRQFRKMRYNVLNHIQMMNLWPAHLRRAIVRMMGHNLAPDTNIADRVYIKGFGLVMCSDASINTGCHLDAVAGIFIGSGVRMGCEAMICTSSHDIGDATLRAGDVKREPVHIGEGSWIGARSVILPGVNVAPGCIIAAGAVVAKDTLPNGLYAGCPAKRMRDLDADFQHLPIFRGISANALAIT